MEAAYFGVYIWKQAAEKAKSFEVDAVRKAVYGQEFTAPGGKIKMDEANQHTYKPVLIGEILKDGQFKVVSRSKGLVKAEPWSQYTSPDKGCDWIKHQGTYQKNERGRRVRAHMLRWRGHGVRSTYREYASRPLCPRRLASGPFSAPCWVRCGFGVAPAPAAESPPAELAKYISDVASADGAVQEAAAVALGKTGDRKILPLLEALREGSVYVRTGPGGQKETVIVGDKVAEGDKTLVPLFSAYGREPLTGADGKPLLVDVSTLQDVSAGRSLRLALRPLIDGFSGSSQLADPDPNVRRAAATKMGNAADVSALPALSEALGKERERWARHAIEEAMALINLRAGDEAARIAAAARLGDLRSVNALDRLRDVGVDAAAPASLRQAALESVKRIERWALLTSTIETIFQGVSLSSILLLMALGLAIVFGLMGVINMAHGELMALGAYATFVVQGWFSAPCAGLVRLLLPRGPAVFVPGGGSGRLPAGAGRDPLPVRPPTGDLAADVGREPHDPAGAPAVVRRGERGRDVAEVAVGRHSRHGRAPAPVQPALHHRPGHRLRERDVLPAVSNGRRPQDSRGDAEPRRWPRVSACGRGGWTRSRLPSARVSPGSPGARSRRSAMWARSSGRTTSSTRSWSW